MFQLLLRNQLRRPVSHLPTSPTICPSTYLAISLQTVQIKIAVGNLQPNRRLFAFVFAFFFDLVNLFYRQRHDWPE